MDWSQYLLPLLQIIGINIVLSGDNAVVIAIAAHHLPQQHRRKAFIFGAGGAIAVRVVATVVMAYLLKVPLLLLIGGLLLTVIALKLLLEEEDAARHVGQAENLMHAIKTIIVADIIMSLDNMLAVAGASHSSVGDGMEREANALIVFGLLVSIVIIMTCSALIATLMDRYPILVALGAGILAWTAGRMMVDDRAVEHWIGQAKAFNFAIPALVTVVVVASPRWTKWIKREPPSHVIIEPAERLTEAKPEHAKE